VSQDNEFAEPAGGSACEVRRVHQGCSPRFQTRVSQRQSDPRPQTQARSVASCFGVGAAAGPACESGPAAKNSAAVGIRDIDFKRYPSAPARGANTSTAREGRGISDYPSRSKAEERNGRQVRGRCRHVEPALGPPPCSNLRWWRARTPASKPLLTPRARPGMLHAGWS